MENRLCHKYGESFSARETPRLSPQEVAELAKTEREKLDNKVINGVKISAIRSAGDFERIENAANDNFGEALPQRLRDISAKYGPLLRGSDGSDGSEKQEGIQQRLLENIPPNGPLREEVRGMIEAIARPLPPNAAQGQFRHRYVQLDKGGKNKPDWYGVNFKQITADLTILNGLRTVNNATAQSNPELNADIALLEQALNEFQSQDGRIIEHRIRTAPDQLNGTFMEVGRLTLILAGAGMTLLTGFIGLVNLKNKGITAMSSAVLYGMVTLAAANPGLIKRMLGSKSDAYVDNLKRAMEDKGVENASIQYNAVGPAWKTFATRMMSDPKTTQTFLAESQKFGIKPEEDEKVIDRYVHSLMPDEGTAREDLKRMIRSNDFKAFAGNLLAVTDKDAKQTVLDLIGKGTMKYGSVARADAKNAEAELTRVEQEMPKPL